MNVDGTTNRAGSIMRYTNLRLSYQNKEEDLLIYITNLGRDQIILGLPWFQYFEPTISWKKGTLQGEMKVRITNVIMQINKMTMATTWTIEYKKEKKSLKENDIPNHYQEFVDVFLEEKAKRFPPSREEDHEIEFMEEVPKIFKLNVYQMSIKQTTFLRKWLDKELAKGYIQPSKSPYSSPTFLIEKKNGDFRVVQDYKRLNDYTIPDKHPFL